MMLAKGSEKCRSRDYFLLTGRPDPVYQNPARMQKCGAVRVDRCILS